MVTQITCYLCVDDGRSSAAPGVGRRRLSVVCDVRTAVRRQLLPYSKTQNMVKVSRYLPISLIETFSGINIDILQKLMFDLDLSRDLQCSVQATCTR